MHFVSIKSANLKSKSLPIIAAFALAFGAKAAAGINGYVDCVDTVDPSYSASSTSIVSQVQEYSAGVVYVEDDTIYVGEEIVVNEGCDGVKEEVLEITYEDDHATSVNVLETKIIKEAVPTEIHVGTKERPTFMLPVDNYTYSYGVGYREDGFHTGMDLLCPDGTNVKAAADGVVVYADWESSYGLIVFVDHGNGIVTGYAHMSHISVTEGQVVSQGESLGLSGSTGNVTCPHVHMEFWENGSIIDPVAAGYVNP